MRLWIIIALAAVTLGCRATDSSSRREIALLRTEILDLEDQYYALQSRCADHGMVDNAITSGYVDQYYPGDVQYAGSAVGHATCADCGNPVYGATGHQGFVGQSGVIYNNPSNGHLITDQPIQPLISDQHFIEDPSLDHLQNQGPEAIQGQEIIDPIGQPFDETPAGSSSKSSSRPRSINPGNFLKGVNDQVRSRTGRDVPFQPDPRFAAQNDLHSWRQRSGSGSRETDGWAQNRNPSVNNVELFNKYDTGQVGGRNSQYAQPRWQQSSAQRPVRDEPQDQYSLDSEPLDDRYLAGQEYDEYTDFAEANSGRGSASRVEQVFINPEHTYSRDFDNDGEEDGISLLIQPLDERGRIVTVASDLVVSLIDPSEIGEKQRIGLWKYESYQVESLVSNRRGQRGLLLDLPWQRRVPGNDRLLVFVRYTTPQGERLETSLDIRVTPPDSGYDLEIGDSVVGRGQRYPNDRNVRSVPTTAGNPVDVPQWRPVR